MKNRLPQNLKDKDSIIKNINSLINGKETVNKETLESWVSDGYRLSICVDHDNNDVIEVSATRRGIKDWGMTCSSGSDIQLIKTMAIDRFKKVLPKISKLK